MFFYLYFDSIYIYKPLLVFKNRIRLNIVTLFFFYLLIKDSYMLNVHTKAQSILTCPLFCDLIFTIYFILFTANPNMNNLYIYI